MPLPNRTNLIAWWQNPANVIPYSPANGGIYSQHYPSGSNWWPNTAPVSNDISISIDGDGRPLIFLWGNLADFSDIPTSEFLRADQYRITGIAMPRTGLKVTISDWNNAGMVLSEISLEITSHPTTANLQSVLTIILRLIGTIIPRGGLLSSSSVKGLYGELVLLERLLVIARDQNNTATKQSVLDSWKGYIRPTPNTPFGARRDFSRVGSNIKIEVKTTGNDNREHSIENYLQLIEAPPEHIFLYSVAARNDATGGATLPAQVQRIRDELNNQGLIGQFETFLSTYGNVGYHEVHAPFYNNQENRLIVNTFPPGLFDLRLVDYFDGTQFQGNPPAHSSNYKYVLSLTTLQPVQNEEQILLQLIQ